MNLFEKDLDLALTSPYQAPQWCLTVCDNECMAQFYYYGFMISAVFSTLCTLICLYNVFMHLTNFNNPYFQSKIIIIVLMPPVYCITSTLSFLSVNYSSYITLVRSLYENMGIFAFFYLIFSFIAYDHEQNKLDQKKVYIEMCVTTTEIPHDYPCNYLQKPYQLSSWRKAKYFANRCKRAILQFIIINIVVSIFFIVIYPNYQLRIRDQNDWDYQLYNKVSTYIYWIQTISSYVAYYYISMFYGAMQKKLKPYKPQLKFITFNTTIYYMYWQKVWMVFFQSNLMACFDQDAPQYYSKKLMYCIENFLICIQMFFMSLAILQAYNYQDYVVRNLKRKCGSIWYIITDIFLIFRMELMLFKPKRFGFSTTKDDKMTELLTIDCLNKTNKTTYKKSIKVQLHSVIKEGYF